jgi:hypothetical protein
VFEDITPSEGYVSPGGSPVNVTPDSDATTGTNFQGIASSRDGDKLVVIANRVVETSNLAWSRHLFTIQSLSMLL